MRHSLRPLFASAVAFPFVALSLLIPGCASDLWNRYVRDTEDSCLRVGCPGGGTCNRDTGLCEGGPGDMGTTDMGDPSQGDFFSAPVPITPTALYEKEVFYQLSTTQAEQGSGPPVIWLSGPLKALVRLTTDLSGQMADTSVLTLDEQPCYLTSIQSTAKGGRDLLVGQLARKFSRVSGAGATTFSTQISGFKLLSVGDLNNDGYPDAIVTASQLSLANLYYRLYANADGDGQAEIFVGDSAYQLQNKSNSPIMGPLISATIQQKRSRTVSGFNVGAIGAGAGEETSALLAQVDVSVGAPSWNIIDKVAIPASDFAIPVDLDGDTLNDLLLIQLWNGKDPFLGIRGAVHVAHNTGIEGKPVFESKNQVPVPLQPGLVLTAQVEDFDQDGFPDLAVATATVDGGEVQLYHNELPPATTKETRRKLRYIGKMSSTYVARAIEFVDLNRDGCKDIVMLFSGGMGAAATGTNILWAAGRKAGRGLPDCF